MSIEIKLSKKRIPYGKAMFFLNKRVEAVKNGDNKELIWILEHPKTYTAGVSFKQSEIINTFEVTKYGTFPSDMVGKISFYSQAANSLTGDDVRISKRLYIPYKKLRGFEKGKVGPKDDNSYIGGNYVSALNLSTTLPQILPSLQNTDFSFFVDMANVWGVDYNSSIDDGSTLRSSAGLSIDLLTAIGPLNFSFSETISKASSDRTESFRFNIGTSF